MYLLKLKNKHNVVVVKLFCSENKDQKKTKSQFNLYDMILNYLHD